MPFAKVNGIELYYETHGSGPALVFAHGGRRKPSQLVATGAGLCFTLYRGHI